MHIFSKQSLISSEDIQLYLSNITGLNQENANSKIFFFLSSLSVTKGIRIRGDSPLIS